VIRPFVRIAAVVIALSLVGVAAPVTADASETTTDYVVHASTAAEATAAASALGVHPRVTFNRVFAGFAAPLTRTQVGARRARPRTLSRTPRTGASTASTSASCRSTTSTRRTRPAPE
jgi:hypothetical protein